MNKKTYQVPFVEIRSFSCDEVITASTPVTTKDPKDPIELPFVHAE